MDIALHSAARTAWNDTSPAVQWVLQSGSFIKYIGHDQPEGASAPLSFYLFWCSHCGRPAKDYLHGFSGKEFINCSGCGAYKRVRLWRAYVLRSLAHIQLFFLSIYWRIRSS